MPPLRCFHSDGFSLEKYTPMIVLPGSAISAGAYAAPASSSACSDLLLLPEAVAAANDEVAAGFPQDWLS